MSMFYFWEMETQSEWFHKFLLYPKKQKSFIVVYIMSHEMRVCEPWIWVFLLRGVPFLIFFWFLNNFLCFFELSVRLRGFNEWISFVDMKVEFKILRGRSSANDALKSSKKTQISSNLPHFPKFLTQNLPFFFPFTASSTTSLAS